MLLNKIGEEIWLYEGSKVNFHGFPFPTRMTVVRLNSGELWVHSPEKLSGELGEELSALGEVSYLISPNKLHHLFLDEWDSAYPDAIKYSSPGLAKKRKDVNFDAELLDSPADEWKEDLAQTIFRGSPAMEEVVFYHKLSRTLVVTDLVENFDPNTLSWWQKGIAKAAGVVHPNGKMPIDWRLSFLFGSRKQARDSLHIIMSWDFENVVLSHGECVFGNGKAFIRKSFSWLTTGQ